MSAILTRGSAAVSFIPEDGLPPQALAERLERTQAIPLSELQPDIASWERKTCRVCRQSDLIDVLNLGEQPPANAFVAPPDAGKPEPRYPLTLRLCESCGMVQLEHVVPPELLFRSYLFFTSSSRWMADHFSHLMNDNADEFVPAGGLVVEIGSNDGTSLSSLRRRDVRLLGIDPARNIQVMAASRAIPTIAEFFSESLAGEVARVAGQASLIVACNVLGHIDDLDDVCRGVRRLLSREGAFVFEVPYLQHLLDRTEYDTIYHEHLSYFAVRPLVTLMNRHGLRMERVQAFPVHGGTIRCTARLGDGFSEDVGTWLDREAKAGLADRFTYGVFAAQAARNRHDLPAKLTELKHKGLKVVGYGAPAKGTVRLNYCQVTTTLLPTIVDSTPAKQGLLVPGMHQPILPPSALADLNPDVLLLLAWNHAPEILAREAEFKARGGKFLTPNLEEL